MDNLDDILEFVDSVHYQGGELRKSHVKATVRHLKSGKAVAVKEHEDKRPVRELSAKEKAGWLKHKQESSVNPKYHEDAGSSDKMAEILAAHKRLDQKYKDAKKVFATHPEDISTEAIMNGSAKNFAARSGNMYLALRRGQYGFTKDVKNAALFSSSADAKKAISRHMGTPISKSLIHAFKRLLSSGKQVMVAEHSDNRQPRGDFASTSLMSGLGQAAKEAAAQAKPVVPFFQALKKIPIDRLHAMRVKLGKLSHKTLMKEHNGRPLHFWLAAVDGELGRREGATA